MGGSSWNRELNTIEALDLLELPAVYCSADTVRRQYRGLVRQYHPDNRATGNEERFEEIQEAYEYFSKHFAGGNHHSVNFARDNNSSADFAGDHDFSSNAAGRYAGSGAADGWTTAFAEEFRYDAENYAPPSRDLNPTVAEVRRALAKRPIDYEGLLLRAEWLEHNLTDGSCDGTELLETLGEVQRIRDSVDRAEQTLKHIGGRIGAAEAALDECEDILREQKSIPLIGNLRYKASLEKKYRAAMKRAGKRMDRLDRAHRELDQLERFCRETVMDKSFLEKVEKEQSRLGEVDNRFRTISREGRLLPHLPE